MKTCSRCRKDGKKTPAAHSVRIQSIGPGMTYRTYLCAECLSRVGHVSSHELPKQYAWSQCGHDALLGRWVEVGDGFTVTITRNKKQRHRYSVLAERAGTADKGPYSELRHADTLKDAKAVGEAMLASEVQI